MQTGTHFRTCNLCEATCGLAIEVEQGKITSIRGDTEDRFSRGYICPKALALQDVHEDPDRLRTPLRRNGDAWEEISWEEAFSTVATRLAGIQKIHGRNAIGVYLGNPNVHNHGAMLAMMPFLQALGTHNRFSATSNDQLPHMLANLELFGHQALFPIPDIDHTDLFICIGANPMASNGSLMTVPDFRGRLKDLQARGGRFVAIDPRRTETADRADAFHYIRPGSDALLLMAMVNTVFAEGLAQTANQQGWLKDLDLVRLAAGPFTPEKVSVHTGIDAQAVRELTRDLANTPRALIYGRMGTSTQAHGGVATWLLYVLNILTGKLDRPGGMLFTAPAVDLVTLGGLSGQKGHFGRRYSRVRGLPEFGGEFPSSTMADEILTPGEGQIRAFVAVAGNPALSSPNGRRLEQAFAQLDFMVSVDYYLNETNRHADIILPPVASLERSHYDLIFNALAVRNVAKFADALFEPAPDARTDWEIMLELGQRLSAEKKRGWQDSISWKLMKLLGPDRLTDLLLRTGPYGVKVLPGGGLLEPGFDSLTRLLPRKHWLRELLDMGPYGRPGRSLPKGLSLGKLRKNPHGIDLGPLRPSLPQRLQTHDGKINLAPRRYLADVERLQARLDNPPPADALQLIGRRQLRSNNSWMHNSRRLVKGKSRCTAVVNPADAARLGLTDGQSVQAHSDVGRIVLPVEVSDRIMAGVVSIPHGWGHDGQGTRLAVAEAHAGASVNDLIDDHQVDPVSGVSVLNGQYVWLTPVPSSSPATGARRAPGKSRQYNEDNPAATLSE
ncbi:molybdopterin-dependent oxidoreductase [Hydrocarboniclastica marina]|uniref:Molybdopterin oxidoreductase family protein n=1 Tax=Hydrocarboniclastica marina TaxID=2259620 RepID=A0A4P7XGI9_9ALTE|nr:molybdopterin-dependent oxidoreductase [Hydrocarboniclastica marina]QCF24877.1 molybdopterin oxidoreductase family protein [Hydrocarboniclastica marina]